MEPTAFTSWEELSETIWELVEDGLVTASGVFPDFRFVPTPAGLQALRAAEDHDALVRNSARELAEKRHRQERNGNIIELWGTT
jgi:hypothetical protein